jgi:hypothetical protein
VKECGVDVDCKGTKKFGECVADKAKCKCDPGKTCGPRKVAGKKKWTLTVTQPKEGNGKECIKSGEDSVTDCECPVDCVANDEYGKCGAPFTCDGKSASGKGKQPHSKRTVTQKAANGGKECPAPVKEKECDAKCAVDCVETAKTEDTCQCDGKSTTSNGGSNGTTYTVTTPAADGDDRKAKACSKAENKPCKCELDADCDSCRVVLGSGYPKKYRWKILKDGTGPNGKKCTEAMKKGDKEVKAAGSNPDCVCLPACALQHNRVEPYFNSCTSCSSGSTDYKNCRGWEGAFNYMKKDALNAFIKKKLPPNSLCGGQQERIITSDHVRKSETKREAAVAARKRNFM